MAVVMIFLCKIMSRLIRMVTYPNINKKKVMVFRNEYKGGRKEKSNAVSILYCLINITIRNTINDTAHAHRFNFFSLTLASVVTIFPFPF